MLDLMYSIRRADKRDAVWLKQHNDHSDSMSHNNMTLKTSALHSRENIRWVFERRDECFRMKNNTSKEGANNRFLLLPIFNNKLISRLVIVSPRASPKEQITTRATAAQSAMLTVQKVGKKNGSKFFIGARARTKRKKEEESKSKGEMGRRFQQGKLERLDVEHRVGKCWAYPKSGSSRQ